MVVAINSSEKTERRSSAERRQLGRNLHRRQSLQRGEEVPRPFSEEADGRKDIRGFVYSQQRQKGGGGDRRELSFQPWRTLQTPPQLLIPPLKNKNIRRRNAEEGNDDEDNDNAKPSVVVKKRKPQTTDNVLRFSLVSSSLKKLESEAETETIFHFESSKEIQVQNDNRATATLETETEFDRDARAIRERALKQAEENLKGKGKSDEKLYRGIHGYTDYKAGFRREQTVSTEKAGGSHGPLRASAHIRTSARFDYQPDICKDYKEIGYCGYGDSCKFMHDRGDYKSGWQMEREWEEAEKVRKRRMALGVDDVEKGGEQSDEDEDGLPFACFICREPFTLDKNPVVTKCKHYFCQNCALDHNSRSKKCYVCNKATMGIFNTAHEIRKKVMERS